MNKKNITKRTPIKKRFGLIFLKGFTLIEIIIVIAIVSVLMLSLKSIFQVKNKDQYYAQACSNNIYGQVSNFIYQGITSKSIRTGGNLYYPESYKVIFNYSQNGIFLYYTMGDGTTGIKDMFYLTGAISSTYYCKSESYNMSISGQGLTILEFVKGLQEKSDSFNVFEIKDVNGNQYITGSVFMRICDKSNIVCRDVSEYLIDKRNQNIIKKLCMTWSDSGDCQERDQ